MTFDGTSYSFLGNCTYTLVKEIRPRHGNLSVLIDNHYCSAHTTTSCPPALRVHYESTEIILTTTSSSAGEESLVSPWAGAAGPPHAQARSVPSSLP